MTDISRILLFMVGCIFTHNVVFDRMLGVHDAGQPRRFETSVIYGVVVCIVMTLSSVCCWAVQTMMLAPMHYEFLQLIAFSLIVVAVTALVQLCVSKVKPQWAETLDNCLMPIAANCAVLGIAIINAEAGYDLLYALLSGICGGLGFLLAIVLLAGVYEKLEFAKVPEPFRGMPIAVISAGLIALAFIGFKGIA